VTSVNERLLANKALCLIVAFGFGLRVSCLFWGLNPFPDYSINYGGGFYDPDERAVYDQALGFPGNIIHNPPYAYGSTVPYAVGLVCLPFKELFSSLMNNPRAYETLIIVMCRLGSVCAGTASIALAYLLARRFSGHVGGLIAAGFLAVSFTHCMNSVYCNLDIWMGFLLLANFVWLFAAFEPPGPDFRRFAILGILTGLLVGTKVTTGIFVAAPAALWLWRVVQDRRLCAATGREFSIAGWLFLFVAYGVTAGAVYAITNPHIVLHLRQYFAFMRELKRTWYDSHAVSRIEVLSHWTLVSQLALGTPVCILAAAGVVVLWRVHRAYTASLVSVLALHYSLFPYYFQTRYVATIAPLLCALAAAACAQCLASRRLAVRGLGGYLVVVAVAYSGLMCASGYYFRVHDPRDVALDYLQKHIAGHCTYAYGDTDFGNGEWLYPVLDRIHFEKVGIAETPDVILVDVEHMKKVKEIIDLKLLDENDRLTDAGIRQWSPSRKQTPQYFRAYRELIDKDGRYQLVFKAESPHAVRPEYSSLGLSVFVRRDRLVALGLTDNDDEAISPQRRQLRVVPCARESDVRTEEKDPRQQTRPSPTGPAAENPE
jgi:hypothetical protein